MIDIDTAFYIENGINIVLDLFILMRFMALGNLTEHPFASRVCMAKVWNFG